MQFSSQLEPSGNARLFRHSSIKLSLFMINRLGFNALMLFEDTESEMDWEKFFTRLDELGYFRYLSNSSKKRIPSMQKKVKQTGYFFGLHAKRDYPADPKNLAKCGVKSFLLEIRPILKANGVLIQTIEENCSREGYTIEINHQEYLLYTAEELYRPDNEFWDLTTTRSFSIINGLLKAANSDERIFSTFGGMEEWSIFLTMELYNLLLENGFIETDNELFLYENFDE